jgi:hypothetical protein
MQTTRRSFLARSAAAAGTSLLFTPSILRAERTAGLPSRVVLGLSEADREVLAVTSQYSRACIFTGGGVLARLRPDSGAAGSQAPLSIRVSVEHRDRFVGALASWPFANSYADGNTLQFDHLGGSYEVESLESSDFKAVQLDLRAGRGGDLAHDSLSWNPSTNRLTDPHGVITSEAFRLRRVEAPSDSMDQVRQWVRGWVDAANYSLEPDAEFRAFHRRVRSSTVPDEASAREVAGILIHGLAVLRLGAPAATVSAFLGSPLSRATLPVVTGEEVAAGIIRHRALNRLQQANGGAGWLAAVFGADRLNSDAVHSLNLTGTVSAFRTRVALRAARRLSASQPALDK